MSPPEMQTAASWQGGSGRGISKGLAAGNYPLPTENATDFARDFLARRLRLPDHLAALVAELAGIGATYP